MKRYSNQEILNILNETFRLNNLGILQFNYNRIEKELRLKYNTTEIIETIIMSSLKCFIQVGLRLGYIYDIDYSISIQYYSIYYRKQGIRYTKRLSLEFIEDLIKTYKYYILNNPEYFRDEYKILNRYVFHEITYQL